MILLLFAIKILLFGITFVDCWEPPLNPGMSAVIPLGKIFGDKSIRVTPRLAPTDERFSSVRDIIMVVAEKDGNHASQTWRELPESFKKEVNLWLTSNSPAVASQNSQ